MVEVDEAVVVTKLRALIDEQGVGVATVITKLQALVKEHGGARQLAEHIGTCDEAIYAVLNGKRPPTGKVLEATGYKKTIRYAPIEVDHEV